MQTFTVLGPFPIQDSVTGEAVPPGGQVRLDEAVIRVRPLLDAGFIKPAATAPVRRPAGGGGD